MIECRAILHDKTHAKFKNKENNVTVSLKAFECFISLDSQLGLKFHNDKSSKEELFSIDPERMNLDLDKNSR